MTGSLAQRLAACVIRLSCRMLPEAIRDERYREWTAELPAILHDPAIRLQIRRDLRALRFAAGHTRTSLRLAKRWGWVVLALAAPAGAVFIVSEQQILVYMFLPWFAGTVIEDRMHLSWQAIRLALHPTRGDPLVRRWLASLLIVTSYAAFIAANFTRQPWLPATGSWTAVAGLAIWIIPMIVARHQRASTRNRAR